MVTDIDHPLNTIFLVILFLRQISSNLSAVIFHLKSHLPAVLLSLCFWKSSEIKRPKQMKYKACSWEGSNACMVTQFQKGLISYKYDCLKSRAIHDWYSHFVFTKNPNNKTWSSLNSVIESYLIYSFILMK